MKTTVMLGDDLTLTLDRTGERNIIIYGKDGKEMVEFVGHKRVVLSTYHPVARHRLSWRERLSGWSRPRVV